MDVRLLLFEFYVCALQKVICSHNEPCYSTPNCTCLSQRRTSVLWPRAGRPRLRTRGSVCCCPTPLYSSRKPTTPASTSPANPKGQWLWGPWTSLPFVEIELFVVEMEQQHFALQLKCILHRAKHVFCAAERDFAAGMLNLCIASQKCMRKLIYVRVKMKWYPTENSSHYILSDSVLLGKKECVVGTGGS